MAILAAAGGAAVAQPLLESEGGDVLTAHDGRGNISTVYNLFDGRSHSIQVARLDLAGVTRWNVQHLDGLYEKAYAAGMDLKGNLFVAGVRKYYGRAYFLLLKFAENGYLAFETVDNQHDCTASDLALDRDGNAVVAGLCRRSDYYHPARVAKFRDDGTLLWAQEYDGGGRNYVRGLQVDYHGHVSVTVETVYGNYRDGSYSTRTILYDPDGRQLQIR